MGTVRIHKQEIVRRQLETAVALFMEGHDRSSVITLAGAAIGILDSLARNAGKEPFRDYGRRVIHEKTGTMPKRDSYAHFIEDSFGITALKHLGKGEPDTVELDLEKNAVKALDLGIAEYRSVTGADEAFYMQYVHWRHATDKSLLEAYEKLPARMKRK